MICFVHHQLTYKGKLQLSLSFLSVFFFLIFFFLSPFYFYAFLSFLLLFSHSQLLFIFFYSCFCYIFLISSAIPPLLLFLDSSLPFVTVFLLVLRPFHLLRRRLLPLSFRGLILPPRRPILLRASFGSLQSLVLFVAVLEVVVVEGLGRVEVVPRPVHLTSRGASLVHTTFFSTLRLLRGVVEAGILNPLMVLWVCAVVGLELVLAEAELPEDGVLDAVALVPVLVDPRDFAGHLSRAKWRQVNAVFTKQWV